MKNNRNSHTIIRRKESFMTIEDCKRDDFETTCMAIEDALHERKIFLPAVAEIQYDDQGIQYDDMGRIQEWILEQAEMLHSEEDE